MAIRPRSVNAVGEPPRPDTALPRPESEAYPGIHVEVKQVGRLRVLPPASFPRPDRQTVRKPDPAEQALESSILMQWLVAGVDREKHQAAIAGLRRRSRPGRRLYEGHTDLPKVMNGLGIAIMSTSRGVMTDKDARREQIGGEFLCEVW